MSFLQELDDFWDFLATLVLYAPENLFLEILFIPFVIICLYYASKSRWLFSVLQNVQFGKTKKCSAKTTTWRRNCTENSLNCEINSEALSEIRILNRVLWRLYIDHLIYLQLYQKLVSR